VTPSGTKGESLPKLNLQQRHQLHQRGERGGIGGFGDVVMEALQFVIDALRTISANSLCARHRSLMPARQHRHRPPGMWDDEADVPLAREGPVEEKAGDRPRRVEEELGDEGSTLGMRLPQQPGAVGWT